MNFKKRELFEGISSWMAVTSNVKRRGEEYDQYATIRVDLTFCIEMPRNQKNKFDKTDS